MKRSTYWLLVLSFLLTSTSGALAQNAGKTGDTPTTYHRLAERFDVWRQKAGNSPEVNAYIERLSHRYEIRTTERSNKGATLPKGLATSFEDMVTVTGQKDDRSNNMSFLISASNGDLLIVWKDWGIATSFFGIPEVPPAALFARSTDGGATWSEPVPVSENSDFVLDYNWPTLIETASNRLLVFYDHSLPIMSYSDDGGVTWEEGARNDFDFDTYFGLIDGNVWHASVNFNTERWVYRTSADGLTWSDPANLFPFVSEGAEFYLSGISDLGNSKLLAYGQRFTFEPCCTAGLVLRASTDGGATWGPLESLPFSVDELEAFDSRVTVSDGEIWMAIAADNFPAGIQSDIYYMSSSDEGATWTAPARFTRYGGGDYNPAIAMTADGPVIAFTSERYLENTSIWYGVAGVTPDLNPPPYVTFVLTGSYPQWQPANAPLDIGWIVADEGSVSAATMVLEYGSETQEIPLLDDGVDPDEVAGDGIFSATLPGLPFGETATYYATATDDGGQTASGPLLSLDRIPVADVGQAIVAVDQTGHFGQLFNVRFPSVGAGQWPGPDGFNYIWAGGLWLGLQGSTPRVMHTFYDNEGDPDWVTIDGLYPVASTAVSDADFNFSFTDAGAPAPVGVRVDASMYQWAEGAAGNGVVLRYEITNRTTGDFDGIVPAISMDPDFYIEVGASFDDLVGIDNERGLIYAYDSGQDCASEDFIECTDAHLGLMVIEDGTGKRAGLEPYTAHIYTENQDPSRNGTSDRRFYELMRKGVATQAQLGTLPPNDYRIIIAPDAFPLAAGETKAVAFALVFGSSPEDLGANADAIEAAYNAAPVAIEEEGGEQPATFGLGQNYPNPFNPSTVIPFSIEEAGHVTVTISDILGRTVATVADEQLSAGSYRVSFSGENLPSGSYFYTLKAGGKVQTKTLFLLK